MGGGGRGVGVGSGGIIKISESLMRGVRKYYCDLTKILKLPTPYPSNN